MRGEIAQEVLNCFLAALTWSMLPLLGEACLLDRRVGIFAAILGSVLTLNRWVETKGSSEGAMAGLACVIVFVFYMKCWYAKDFSVRSGVLAGFLSGLAILVSASLGSVVFSLRLCGYLVFRTSVGRCYLCFVLWWRSSLRCSLGRYVIILFSAASFWTRSNLPLELVSNNDDALPNLRDNQNFWYKYHPFMSSEQRADVQKMGEVAYQRKLRAEVLRWTVSHPRLFAWLTLRRIYYFWFPAMKRPLQTIGLGLFTVASVPGLIFLIKRKQVIAYALLAILMVYPLVYYFVKPTPGTFTRSSGRCICSAASPSCWFCNVGRPARKPGSPAHSFNTCHRTVTILLTFCARL